jgi:hypothetical protein
MLCLGCKKSLRNWKNVEKSKGLCLNCTHRAKKDVDFRTAHYNSDWVNKRLEEVKEKANAMSDWLDN